MVQGPQTMQAAQNPQKNNATLPGPLAGDIYFAGAYMVVYSNFKPEEKK
jgi:hypothetical protein